MEAALPMLQEDITLEVAEEEERDNAWYDSKRTYLEQLLSYKDHQNKEWIAH